MSSLGRALVNDQGVVIGGVDAVRDIQAQKNAQIALEESEERFRRAMMDAAIGMAIVSASGDFERVNPAMSTLLGRDEPTLMASTWRGTHPPEDLDIDLQLVQEVIDGTRGDLPAHQAISEALRGDRLGRSHGFRGAR